MEVVETEPEKKKAKKPENMSTLMASKGSVALWILLLATSSSSSATTAANTCILTTDFDVSSLNRSSFPAGFVFGTASSAYQYEGAASEDGKGPSIWDYYTQKYPEKIKDGSNGDVAIDAYHQYKEDVGIMKEMNLDAYRFSISWSRLLPNGKLSGGVNKEGIEYYNNLINELLDKGLKPYVTLFHWDVPQTLEDQYGGFLSPRIVKHFREYTELCFREFGDRVKYWITLNEPWSFSVEGYATAKLAPYRCSQWQQLNCTGGDSGTEPYIVAHHQLLSHAAAVKIYKNKYQASQKGLIGIALVSGWKIPFSDTEEDRNATLRMIDFTIGWFMDPLTNGDYPHSMRSYVGKRLPKFSEEQSKLVKGSFDFVGMNYYSTNYASNVPPFNNTGKESCITDLQANGSAYRFGIPIGEPTALDWLYVYPKGFYEMLLYTKEKYHNPLIYITENGVDELNDPNIPLAESLMDYNRIDYHYHHLYYLQKAIKDGVNVKGYFAWSLLDNFEWSDGYTVRFGFNYVDYRDGLKRYPKLSAHWFKAFLQKPYIEQEM